MNRYQQHQNKLNKTTLYLQKAFPSARFFSRHVGKFYSQRILHSIKNLNTIEDLRQWFYAMKNKYLVSINKPGMPDQYIILPVIINGKKIPIHVEAEFKTGNSKLSPDQKKWKLIYESLGVKYIESRDEKIAEKEIQEYIKWVTS